MKKHFLKLALLFTCLVAGVFSFSQHQLIKVWETDSVLKVPESVFYDSENKVLYVSNIDGTDPWARDSKGSIGKVGLDGKIIAVDWITGLHGPKGMGLHKGFLYVADMNEVIMINTREGKIEKRIAVTGADGLNDVSVDKNGVIYVTDSRGKKVFRIKDGVSELFLDNLKGPNGILSHEKDLFVLDAGGMYRVNEDKSLFMIASGMDGGTDGIENVGGNDYIVSCWQGVIWYVEADGTKHKLLDSRADKVNSADIGFDPKNKIVFVPTFWRNTIVAYQVK